MSLSLRRLLSYTLLGLLAASMGACAQDEPASQNALDAGVELDLGEDTVSPEISPDLADGGDIDGADTTDAIDDTGHDDIGSDTTSELDSRPEDTANEDSSALVDVGDTALVDDTDLEDTSSSDISDSSETAQPGTAAMPCDDSRPCAADLVCVTLDTTDTIGFCAPTCTTLHATCGYFGPGVYAECVVTLPDQTLACAFICEQLHGDHSHTHTCPSGDWGRLRCERSAGDFGHHYCVPRQD